MSAIDRPDVVLIMTDQERAAPPYETDELRAWRDRVLVGRRWFDEHAVTFERHYTGSVACVPARPTLFTGHYPDVHGVTQTDGLGKDADDSRMRWLQPDEVPTLGHWFRAGGYDTHYDGKWHLSHADLHEPDTGAVVDTNTAQGEILADGVRRYLEADPLDAYGFSGWVGPEPHGGRLANAGVRRDGLVADRLVAWLEDRYARRAAGDPEAQRPFLLVASFLNPHDIVLFPLWAAQGAPFEADPALDPPDIPAPPTADESLSTKPSTQSAYRDAYYSGYGRAEAVASLYRDHPDHYRRLYHQLHTEVDGPIDRVRRAVEAGGDDAVVVRTADHGDVLGAHGGLHQKWLNLYDEAVRVPFQLARLGSRTTAPRRVVEPTSHVDLVPTLLAAAGIDQDRAAEVLAPRFSELHTLPGRSLLPVLDGDTDDPAGPVYVMTRDAILDGDTGLSPVGRLLLAAGDDKATEEALADLWIASPRHVSGNIEGVVARVPAEVDGGGRVWKLVRTFDDPDTWTSPGVSQLTADGVRTEPLDDEWELYDLDTDPVEAVNRADDDTAVRAHLLALLERERERCVPERNRPWPYRPHPAARVG